MTKISQNYCELVPAYGRDYQNACEVKLAFAEGKDFLGDYSLGFKPCNKENFEKGTKVNLRYCKHRKVVEVTV